MQKGFFASLFDTSFTSLVTTRLIKVLYVLSLVLLAIAYVAIAISLFGSGSQSATLGPDGSLQTDSGGNAMLGVLWLLLVGPLVLFLHTLAFRAAAELAIVLFRILETTRDQLAVLRARAAPGGGPLDRGGSTPGSGGGTPPGAPGAG